jgi:hypothetical protein
MDSILLVGVIIVLALFTLFILSPLIIGLFFFVETLLDTWSINGKRNR